MMSMAIAVIDLCNLRSSLCTGVIVVVVVVVVVVIVVVAIIVTAEAVTVDLEMVHMDLSFSPTITYNAIN